VHDVKTIFESALVAEPGPPLPDAATAIAAARRSQTRRGWTATAGAAAAVTVAAGSIAAVTTHAARTQETPQPAAPSLKSVAAAPLPALPTDPPADARIAAYADAVTGVLRAATPAGYTVSPFAPGSHDYWRAAGGKEWVALVIMDVTRGNHQGSLTAALSFNSTPAPTGDLCSPAIDKLLVPAGNEPPADSCQVITVGATPIRVATYHDPDHGEERVATRFLANGSIQVTADQGRPGTDTGQLPPDAKLDARRNTAAPALTTQPYTAKTLATIAADPKLLLP